MNNSKNIWCPWCGSKNSINSDVIKDTVTLVCKQCSRPYFVYIAEEGLVVSPHKDHS